LFQWRKESLGNGWIANTSSGNDEKAEVGRLKNSLNFWGISV